MKLGRWVENVRLEHIERKQDAKARAFKGLSQVREASEEGSEKVIKRRNKDGTNVLKVRQGNITPVSRVEC